MKITNLNSRNKSMNAPIVLFVYNRLKHTKQAVEALQKNELANNSELFIYSDAAKNKNAQSEVNKVRGYIKKITGFKTVNIFERKKNFGLANSIIDGVTNIINEYGKVIVLEDDLVTSTYFLRYMNDALTTYSDNKKIWEVGGYVYPLSYKIKKDFFFAPYTTSWGWATWSDRWKYFDRNPQKLLSSFNMKKIKQFNLDNSTNLWDQVIKNANGRMFTWAVFWYATVFLNNGLTIYPKRSMVENIGHDGSGMNSGKSNFFDVKLLQKPVKVSLLDTSIDLDIFIEVKKFLKKRSSISIRILNILRRLFT